MKIPKQAMELNSNYLLLVNDKQHGRIQARCHEIKNKSHNIICTFEQIVIQHENIKNWENLIFDIKNKKDGEIKNEMSPCKDIDRNQFKKIINSAKSEDEKKFTLDLKNLCLYPSKDKYLLVMNDKLSMSKSTCTIINKTYTEEFKYNWSTKKWIYQDGPYDNYGTIYLSYLEKRRKKSMEFSLELYVQTYYN